jgi:Bacterial Ig domain/RTX calcium-binding nonapeptide repeat (4 copies)
MREGISSSRQKQQERLSSRTSPLSKVSLTVVFSGLLLMMMMITMSPAPVLVSVFAANIDGTPGDDTLNGTPEPDTINGFEGNDIISGEGGDDILDGGPGSDEIRGGDGIDEIRDTQEEPVDLNTDYNNKVYGGSGNDKIDIDTATSVPNIYYIYGEDGADNVEVTAGEGYVNGGIDDDTIYCTANQCHLNGDEGQDEIRITTIDTTAGYSANGGSGNDVIYSSDNSGFLVGGDGNDHIFGGEDVEGGEGDDILEGPSTYYLGGPGADTFKCSPPNSYDKVRDYNPAEGDQIVSAADCQEIVTVSVLTISFANVNEGQTLSGKYNVVVTASDVSKISNIKLYVDSTLVKQENSAPYEFPTDTTKFADGTHTLKAVATDKSGNAITKTVAVMFDNEASSTPPPPTSSPPPPSSSLTISFANVNEGQTLSGIYEVVVTASDTTKVSNIKLYVDSTIIKTEYNAPYEFGTDTTKFSDGNHVLKAVATDKSGNTITKTVAVMFENQAAAEEVAEPPTDTVEEEEPTAADNGEVAEPPTTDTGRQ